MAKKEVADCCGKAINANKLDEAFKAAGAKRVQAAARVSLANEMKRRAANVATKAVQVAQRRRAEAVEARDVREAIRAKATVKRATAARRVAAQRTTAINR